MLLIKNNDLKDKYMFKIDNRLLYKVDDIILNENNFILFSREETKTSTLYNTLKSISKSDLIIRYNLGTKNLKKDYINDLIEKSIEKEIITFENLLTNAFKNKPESIEVLRKEVLEKNIKKNEINHIKSKNNDIEQEKEKNKNNKEYDY